MQDEPIIAIDGLSNPEVELLRYELETEVDVYSRSLRDEGRDGGDARERHAIATDQLQSIDSGTVTMPREWLRALVVGAADDAMGGVRNREAGAVEQVQAGLSILARIDALA